MAQGATLEERRQGRFWLYAPFVLLLLVAAAWSVAWFVIRGRVEGGLDAWLAAEANAGRQWTCADRAIAGYPFRIEVVCSSLRFQQGGTTASVGRVQSVAQVYQPRHVITEIQGPLRLSDGRVTVQGEWRLLEASVRGARTGLQRASLLAEAPQVRVTGLGEEIAVSGRSLEAHLRPNPGRGASEGALDIASTARGLRLPVLDAFVGGAEETDAQLDLTATQAQGFATGATLDEVERWREAGGQIDVLLLSVTKGSRKLEGKGVLRLDEQHRPAGQLNLAGAGLDGLIANLTGNRGGGLLGALLGQTPNARAQAQGGRPALAPLPPLRLDNGRVALGPFTLPGARLPPLY
jgi:hypothetical protein